MTVMDTTATLAATATVLGVRRLTPDTVVLRAERDFNFEPGHYVRVGLAGGAGTREYSVYSSPRDTAFEILVKAVTDGVVSPELAACRPGDALVVEGPFGHFRLDPDPCPSGRFLFVATGTGIAPFHSMASTYPDLDYQLLHGVSHLAERYEADDFPRERYRACVTREPGGDFTGRVTEVLKTTPLAPDGLFYFCGNSEMILEGFQILADRGVSSDRMFAEIYF